MSVEHKRDNMYVFRFKSEQENESVKYLSVLNLLVLGNIKNEV